MTELVPKEKEKHLSMKELKKLTKQSEKNEQKGAKKLKKAFCQHHDYLSSIKGFSKDITCMAFDQDIAVIASKDKSFRLFSLHNINSISNNTGNNTTNNINIESFLNIIEFNYATSIDLSKSNHLIACGLSNDKTVQVFSFQI